MLFFSLNRRTAFLTGISILILVPSLALAQSTPGSSIKSGLEGAARNTGLVNICTGAPDACLVDVVSRIINIVLGLTGIALFCYLIYGGILWMTAGGEKENVEKATSTIRNAVAGIVIIALAFSVSVFVLGQLSSVLRGTVGAPPAGSCVIADCVASCPGQCPSGSTQTNCINACETVCRTTCR